MSLYDLPLPATRSGALYNAISYPTKISPEAVALFIASHTLPGDTVLDVFGGSGSTGLAAKLCDAPTPRMLTLAAERELDVQWGPRSAELYEIGRLGAFAAEVMCNPPDPRRFTEAAIALVEAAGSRLSELYTATDPDGGRGTLRHIIWSELLRCPGCACEQSYWDAVVRFDPLRLERKVSCVRCGLRSAVEQCARVVEVVHDPVLGRDVQRRRRVPIRTFGKTGRRTWKRPSTSEDIPSAENAAQALQADALVAELEWGDLYRSGYHHGMTHLHHLYTDRNFACMSVLWTLVSQQPQDLQPALRLLLLSYNASHSTLMTRVVVKSGGTDFVITGAQSGVLYVSALPVEKNVLAGVQRKIKTFSEAFSLIRPSRSVVRVNNKSSTKLDLADDSVRYAFTDPPFGDYIPYAEINQVNELWLGQVTKRAGELIVSRAQGKGISEYAAGLKAVFAEVGRVLAPEAMATIVFHSAKPEVWSALTSAVSSAGLQVDLTSILDKTQVTFKQTVAGAAVKGDPLILVRKSATGALRSVAEAAGIPALIDTLLAEAAASGQAVELSKERLFSRLAGHCVQAGVPLPLDAPSFYRVLAEHAASS